jgi:hypothetical protein
LCQTPPGIAGLVAVAAGVGRGGHFGAAASVNVVRFHQVNGVVAMSTR